TYAWSNGATTAAIGSLCAGTYTVTVTDVIGCSATDTIVIVAPTAVTLSMSSVTAHCSLPDGSATVVASGGMGGYTYLWAPGGQTTATASALTPGTYSVTVTDLNGCTATIPAHTNAIGNAMCDGTATATPSGGVAGYTYLWSNGATTAAVTSLC